ncbi:hypothetical protein TTRE_0000332601 [Trichuris trichiura]|uniref:Uncharacterized protein n=1 Tax=Trichuris trichiura TaxID=36087 RepID=A0A077Z8P5_TRITR|nr:hypothetical protein TTRE_0000332601 [Trichuris trichiura]
MFIRRIDDKAAEPAKKDSNAFFYRSPEEYVQSNTADVNNPSKAAGAMYLALRVLEVKTTVNHCESEESDHGDDMLAWSYCDDLSDCSLDPVNLVCDACSSRMKSRKLVLVKDPAKCQTTDRCIQVDIACSDVEVGTVQTPSKNLERQDNQWRSVCKYDDEALEQWANRSYEGFKAIATDETSDSEGSAKQSSSTDSAIDYGPVRISDELCLYCERNVVANGYKLVRKAFARPQVSVGIQAKADRSDVSVNTTSEIQHTDCLSNSAAE